ncbi:MAG TPA: hypothetical protein VGI82_03935 [Chitinophagaceae bacterium]|jgi:hypothetical protein
MSEQIIKHGRKAYKIWSAPGGGRGKKIREFIVEILIIVFAISLSFFIERWQEKRHERKQAVELLKGLKDDLQSDIKELRSDSAGYEGKKRGVAYLLNIKEPVNIDSFRLNYGRVNQTIGLIPNISRFESLKTFGAIDAIRSTKLVNDIFELYQEKIPGLVSSTTTYNERIVMKMGEFLDNNLTYTSDLFDLKNNNLIVLLQENHFRNMLRKSGFLNEIITRYNAAIQLTQMLIREIDDEIAS